jgi:PTS system fructose-specific IIC component/PTS system nitrogen regulatory IIA component
MVIGDVFSPKAINVNLESETEDEVFEELVETFVSAYPSCTASRGELLASLRERESKMSTGIMHGVAVPHCRTSGIQNVRGVIGVSREGIDFDAIDHSPTHIFFLIISSPDSTAYHLRVLKRLALLLETPAFYNEVLAQKSAQDVYDLLCKYEDQLISSM